MCGEDDAFVMQMLKKQVRDKICGLLQQRKADWPDIAQATGIDVARLMKICESKSYDFSVEEVAKIMDAVGYFDAEKALLQEAESKLKE